MASLYEMYGEYLKHFISFMVAPIAVLFSPSSLAFDRLHDKNFLAVWHLYQKLLKKLSERECTIPVETFYAWNKLKCNYDSWAW